MNRSVPVKVLMYVGLGLAIMTAPLLDPLWRSRIINALVIESGFPILLFIAFVVAGVFVVGKNAKRNSYGDLGAKFWVSVVAWIILTLLVLIGFNIWRGYQQNVHYLSTVTISDQETPKLKERAPFTVAERQATSNLGNINGAVGPTDYLANSNHYTTLVSRPGPGNPGYAAIIDQQIALTGQATGTPCTFSDKAGKRMDGWFGNSLTREIAAQNSLLIAKDEDAWGYCDNGKPKVVVPVTKLSNWFAPVNVPAGVAIYDGETGTVELRSEVKVGDLPGPAIGISQAERINESLSVYKGDFWTALFGQSGLTDQVKDGNDPNKDNHTNFSLAYDEPGKEGPVYVSPFTSRASSRSIDNLTIMETGHVKAGENATVSLLHLSASRQSNAATADKIKADFSDLQGWATGWSIQEIVPVSHDEWAASIGLNQNVVYRVLIKTDGTSCLTDADGKKLRCSGDAGSGKPVDNGSGSTAVPSDLGALNNEQLAQLQDQVTKEVLKRLNAAKK